MPSDTTEWGLERRICKVLSANPKVDDFEYTHERQAFRRLCQCLADQPSESSTFYETIAT